MPFPRLPLYDFYEEERKTPSLPDHVRRRIKRENEIAEAEKALQKHKKEKKEEEANPTATFEDYSNRHSASKEQKRGALRLAKALKYHSKLLHKDYHKPLLELAKFHQYWVREPEEWKPRSHNSRRQYDQLAYHLFCEYPIPKWLYNCWLEDTQFGNNHQPSVHTQRLWFIHVGQGGSLRKLPKCPIKLTKRMAHLLRYAPKNYDAFGALRWAQILALGGEEHLVEAVLDTRLGATFKDEDFWITVIQFFVNNPMLDVAHVGPIVDFIVNQKYTPQRVWLEDGVFEDQPPPHPNFSMKGRNPESLLRQVEEWHGRLAKEDKGLVKWEPHPSISPAEYVEGSLEKKNLKIWRITELTNSTALKEEGKKMRHCVSSYVGSCQKGTCSIWSLTLETMEGVERRLTIEVRRGVIVQVRGKTNRLAKQQEKNILNKWCTENELTQRVNSW